MTRSIIRIETQKIQNKLVEMAKLVIDQHQAIAKALKTNDKDKAWEIVGDDRIVNVKFDEITADLEFLITKTPLDKDLRRTMAYIMVAQDLERIGDYVKYIGNFVTQSHKLAQSSITRILDVHKPFMKMLIELQTILVEENFDMAISLAKCDHLINKKASALRTTLISSIVNHQDKLEIAERVFAINVVAAVERAADHITHICELIAYIHTGKHVDLE